jgi:phage shock protein C
MTNLRAPLRRSRDDRMIAGVVGGLARYFNIDPTLARAGYVVISLLSAAFPGLLAYVILWAVVPEE